MFEAELEETLARSRYARRTRPADGFKRRIKRAPSTAPKVGCAHSAMSLGFAASVFDEGMAMAPTTVTLVGRLEHHAVARPVCKGYILLGNGEQETGSRSFAQLDRRARAIASWLRRTGFTGKRVLLIFRDGLEFIDALMGCFYAGVIPVPAAVPRANRSASPLLAIATDAEVAGILTGRDEQTYLKLVMANSLPHICWLCIDEVDGNGDDWSGHQTQPDDLALLQYTSGSTGAPKGVLVTHSNLMHNQAAIQLSMRLSQESLFVGWLPLFHDMGLIGNVMQSLYLGIPCVLMPAVAFLQKPLRWVMAISAYRATISGAPNFAYDLTVEKSSPEQRAALDLSCWEVAFNGSEPIRAETLDRFSKAFAAAKFRCRSFYPCYGMAENTLLITGVTQGTEPKILPLESSFPAGRGCEFDVEIANGGTRLVGCGYPEPSTQIAIVDPLSRLVVPDGTIGEIWVRGGSVAMGYYKNPVQTEETFQARLADTGEGPFLRTGDLGFVRDQQLFVAGRIKDLIIIRGRNHYPQDLEITAQCSNPLLAKNAGVAIGLEDGRKTTIAIIHELTREGWRKADRKSVAADIREAIAATHALHVGHVFLIKPGSLPRTTSGKIRRSACRSMAQAWLLDIAQSQTTWRDPQLEGLYPQTQTQVT
jgi:acyl-CoA synthetase (AMP-forming)/AMP-acid ligase II